jgi:hypothetical protein
MDDIVSKEVNIMEMRQCRLDIANETLQRFIKRGNNFPNYLNG